MHYPNGIATAYEYDTESRLERITAQLGTTVITDFQYTYNVVGNRTEKQTPELTEAYRYDRADQLVEVVRTGTAANRWHYDYDPVGNRTTEQIGNAPVQAGFDNMNRLHSTSAGGTLIFKGTLDEAGTVTVAGVAAEVDSSELFRGTVVSTSGTNSVVVEATDPSGNTRTNTYEVNVSGSGRSFSYDANGSRTQKVDGNDTWTYEWNAENRLTEILKNDVTVATFSYDPFGRRVEKVATGVTTTFIYDGADILKQLAGGTSTYFVHGPGVDEPLAKEVSASLGYYHADGLGSIVARTDALGEVTHEYRYNAYGEIEAGSAEGGFSFTGREWDPECGLFYFRARYLDPKEGRFLSEDPIGLAGGTNVNVFVRNRPTVLRDPSGQIDILGGALSAVGKLNNMYNSYVGLAWGLPALLNGGTVSLGNNAIQFTEHPWMPQGSAVTLGNVICYANGTGPNRLGGHEGKHTYQGEVLGNAYLPAHVLAQAASYATSGRYDTNNPLEWGPNSNPPRSWPW
jgi:RHS repeat-associated protein